MAKKRIPAYRPAAASEGGFPIGHKCDAGRHPALPHENTYKYVVPASKRRYPTPRAFGLSLAPLPSSSTQPTRQ